MGRTGFFDIEKHFAFYGAYHSNPINILIHTLFVWPIFFTTLVILYFTPPIFSSPQLGFDHGLVFNYGFLFAVTYALFYASLDQKAGSLAALLSLLCWVGASILANRLGFSLAWKVVLVAQLICWTGQFIGHGVFEKRAPALLDNLLQAFLMAPFFVLLEVLQSFFGYEPYLGFHAAVKAKVDADIKEFQSNKQKKLS
ncbi:YGL010w-like protein [Quillaja saponaria]|uniref:YGL010w-like protein n=1 Tax=Quillaja saponaria TaxID=32244 RepID=A0AAD7VK37_QUISA|nr:YGL010w-like protein [Quillaja saponaria]